MYLTYSLILYLSASILSDAYSYTCCLLFTYDYSRCLLLYLLSTYRIIVLGYYYSRSLLL